MSQLSFEAQGATTQDKLLQMQESMLPLLDVLTSARTLGKSEQLLVYPSELAAGIGQLTVSRYDNLLQVLIQETQDHAGRGEYLGGDEIPVEFRTNFRLLPSGKIEPDALYPMGMSASLRDTGKRASGLYRPYHWPDGGTSLHFDLFGSLSQEGLDRVQNIVGYLVGIATDSAYQYPAKISA